MKYRHNYPKIASERKSGSMVNLIDRGGAVTTTTSTSAAERRRRDRVVSEAAHSSAMEGLASSPEYRADAAAYVDGTIDIDELGRRTLGRYGLV